MKENVHILLFYKYVSIDDPAELRERQLEVCLELGLKGKVLIAKEGINGSVAGTREKTEEYKKYLKLDKRFSDVIFKEETWGEIPFKRMIVKVKNEIVKFGRSVNLNNTGSHISSKELLDLYNKKEDFFIIDARNNYEFNEGRFKNAIPININKFNEFPKAVEKIKRLKDKKVVLYCTGGIRCEKASAYLKENGFQDVSQLDGGIITFGKEKPNSSIWEGKCFVFDNRVTSGMK